ncbi:hypothetical protein CA54_39290 [Symmachiella macrocystis]|uniref:Uncharacterized protein n=1 Tax=Symmachiella macrocystis TaxID=2527985 RepID=A0A5C6B9D3_9PLAN|nr:hypothetical protein CA54_39290 [Symmachiella macrocystis]
MKVARIDRGDSGNFYITLPFAAVIENFKHDLCLFNIPVPLSEKQLPMHFTFGHSASFLGVYGYVQMGVVNDGKAVGLDRVRTQDQYRLLDLTNCEFGFGEWKCRVFIGAAVADDLECDALGI